MNAWILSRLAAAVEASTSGIDSFRLDEGSGALYAFFWDEFCDWYLELTKPVFLSSAQEEKQETLDTLLHVLESSLRALHPYMPFITEELWQRLPRLASRPASIALSPYPTRADGREDAVAEQRMGVLMRAVSAARSVRSEHEIHPSARVPLELRTQHAEVRELLESENRNIQILVGTEGNVRIAPLGGERPKGTVLAVAGDVEVLVGLRGLVEPHKESERIERQLKKVQKDLGVLEKRLSNPNFMSHAPPEVVQEARDLMDQLGRQRSRLEEARRLLEEL